MADPENGDALSVVSDVAELAAIMSPLVQDIAAGLVRHNAKSEVLVSWEKSPEEWLRHDWCTGDWAAVVRTKAGVAGVAIILKRIDPATVETAYFVGVPAWTLTLRRALWDVGFRRWTGVLHPGVSATRRVGLRAVGYALLPPLPNGYVPVRLMMAVRP